MLSLKSFLYIQRQSALVGMFQRTHDLMWNQENILKSWPEKLPSFAEEESSPKASTSSAKNISQKPSSAAQRQVKKTIRTTTNKAFKATTAEKKLAPDKVTDPTFVFLCICAYALVHSFAWSCVKERVHMCTHVSVSMCLHAFVVHVW